MHALIDTRPFPVVPAPFNLARYVLARVGGMADKLAHVTPHPDRDEGLSYAALLAAIATGFVPVAIATGLSKVEITRLAALVALRHIVHDPGMSLPDHPAPVLMADTFAWSRLAPIAWPGSCSRAVM